MTTSEPPPFRLTDELPAGVTLLEASAGTGKTHTIAALAVRYLAEGVPIDQLLVVTFTRSATGELRARVRQRLVTAEAALRAAIAGGTRAHSPAGDDELVCLLRAGDPEEVCGRQRALAAALADFDAATITTIHGFCEHVLAGLGTAADSGRDLRFVEDLDYLVDEVVDDLYLRKALSSESLAFSRDEARQIVAAALANRDALIEPSAAGRGTTPALRSSLAGRGRDEVLRRARHAGLIGYDDQLARLRDTLSGPSSAVAVRRLRSRYSVVLVDEFQDTDPVQWDIFRIAFASQGLPLLLIGDPKQAIYSFRGADVWAYLAAAAASERQFTLRTNWRSDQPLLDAMDALLADATLGHPNIAYRQVTAAPGHRESGLRDAPSAVPLRLRLLHRADGLVEITKKMNLAQVGSAREVIAADVAGDIVSLLSSGGTLRREPGGPTPVVPGDLAVLVRTNHEATIIHQALDDVAVPAVIAGGGSVFSTPAAGAWLTLLEALEQPAATMRAKAAALTPFAGWNAGQLVDATDGDIDDLQATLHRWAGLLGTRGVAALSETMAGEVGLVARELACVGGERRLTDLRHVAELLHAEALSSGAGARALTAWLDDRVSEAGTDTTLEERSRRLESDAAAVQIQTIHRSKGLEYPIVYLPFLWGARSDNEPLPVYHNGDRGDRRSIDVGGEHADGYERHRMLAGDERRGEDLRQAYVALTRAQHQLVVWWATGMETKSSPLARLLLGRQGNGSISTRPAQVPRSDDEVEARMRELAARVPGRISVERVGRRRGVPWQEVPVDGRSLGISTLDRPLDTVWRRSSYTAITAASHGAGGEPVVTSETEHPGVTDESSEVMDASPEETHRAGRLPDSSEGDTGGVPRADLEAVPSPMADLPTGAGFGIAVHAVCEEVDFAAPDLGSALAERVGEVVGRQGAEAGHPDPAALADALRSVIDTPLGPLAGGRRLRDVSRRDRLDELGFELPLVGGDTPTGRLAVADITACLREWLPPDDPLVGYPDRLEDPVVAQALRGYLTGSIDLVARVPGRPQAGPRHLIVDYKTNWLAPRGEALTAWHYRPARLAEAMTAGHYPLQAVLYSVALHRYLRWRMAGYDPARHLGGVLYLFVRGMCGPATPVVDGVPCGVFSWNPPAGMTVALSDLVDVGA